MHNVKAEVIQVNTLLSKEEVFIAVKSLLRYAEGLSPDDDFDLVPKWYVDTAVTWYGEINPTTSELSQSDLNTAYPEASPGFEVLCESIVDNPLMYKKGESGWYFLPLGTF